MSIALMILCCIAILLLLISLTPVGIDAAYDEVLTLKLKLGVFRLTLLPKKEKKTAPEKEQAPKKDKPKANKAAKPKPEAQPLFTGKLSEIAELLHLLFDVLYAFRQRLVIERIYLRVYFGGDDAAQTAVNYGRAWAAVGALTPMLERCFSIKERDVEPLYAPDRVKTEFRGQIILTIRIGSAIALALSVLPKVIKYITEKKKGRGQHESSSQ